MTPDVIIIGELRDLETIEMAISASETGHLVIGTMHTSDASTTLNRLLDVFPPSQQTQIRASVAELCYYRERVFIAGSAPVDPSSPPSDG